MSSPSSSKKTESHSPETDGRDRSRVVSPSVDTVDPVTELVTRIVNDKIPTDEAPTEEANSKETEEVVDEEAPTTSGRASQKTLVRLERRESAALIILATLAILCVLYAARAILVPITFALLLALTLRPVVRRLERFRIPEVVSSGAILLLMAIVSVVGIVQLIKPAREWVSTMPTQLESIKEKAKTLQGNWKGLEEASSQVKEMAEDETPPDAAEPVPVEVQTPGYSTGLSILSNTGLLAGSVLMVVCLTFFFLAFGDSLINNVLHLLDNWTDKKRTVELVYEVERGIASYLFTVTVINVLLGVAVALAMWLMKMPNPLLWGVMATVFNYVPIFGALVGFVIIALVALVTFDSVGYALLCPIVFCTLTTIEGNFITPSVLGKSMSLNPILVFLALIFWGWIWGVAGAFLAVPLLAVIKVACERFEKTKSLAVLMEA